MPIGSKKLLGGTALTANPYDFTASGSSLSGIAMETGYFPMGSFGGSDPEGYINSSEKPTVNAPTVTILTDGQILTVEIKSLQVKYRTVNAPDVNRTCSVRLRYGRLSNVFNANDTATDVSNIATIQSTAAATYTVSGATYTHTNNFESFNYTGTIGTITSSIYPTPFFFKKTITSSSSGYDYTKIGLIPTYEVSAGGQRVDGSITITISES